MPSPAPATLNTIALTAIACTLLAMAFGPLTPPGGAVTSTAKPLAEVEPRIAVNSTNTPGDAGNAFIITQPGSYYLTGNITVNTGHGVRIAVDNVTLDLNGFTISSTATPLNGTGVVLLGHNATVRNGAIRGATTYSAGAFTLGGFNNGVFGTARTGTRVSNLTVTNVASLGIGLGSSDPAAGSVDNCNVSVCGNSGITAAAVRACTATTTANTAISCYSAADCIGECVGTSGITIDGINAFSTAMNCRGVAAGGTGLFAENALNCSGRSTGGVGLQATWTAGNCSGFSSGSSVALAASVADNCTGQGNNGNGINASNATNCLALSSSGSAAMNVQGTASYCRAQRPGGTAITAGIAIGCTPIAGTVTSPSKHLGTP